MIKIEKNKSYSFILMPNFYDVAKSVIEFEFAYKDKLHFLGKNYFSYILTEDNKIDTITYGPVIQKVISNALTGYYTNSNNDFISTVSINEYLMNEDGEIVHDTYSIKEEKKYLLEDGYKSYKDIVYVKPTNPFDINSGNRLEFHTIDTQGYLQIIGAILVKGEPIYKEGDDQSIIIKMYDDTQPLNEEVEDYKKKMNKRDNVLFDDSARKAFWDNRLRK
jgi:hypothetical protein